MTYRIIIFLLINFLALAIGSFFTSKGVTSAWYGELSKAPWTPPGWVFGVAWATIMICFSVYMASLYEKQKSKDVVMLFAAQFLLNVSWNFIFFNQHLVALGLVIILTLTVLIFYFLLKYKSLLEGKSILIIPYCLWLCIASSLNGYILLFN